MIQRLKNYLLPVGMALLAAMVMMRRLVFERGFVVYRDLFPGQLFYPYLWHPQGSFLALENYKFMTFTGIWLPLRAFGLDVYEKVVYLSAFIIAFCAIYTAVYRLLGWLEHEQHSLLYRHIACGLAALVYVANPAAANIFFDFSLYVGYAFAPLILVFYLEALAGRRSRRLAVFLIAGVWGLSAIKAHWIIFGALLFVFPFISWAGSCLREKPSKLAWRTVGIGVLFSAAIGLVYLLLCAYWLFPFLQAREGRFIGSYAPMTLESVAYLSSTPLWDVVRLLGAFQAWPYIQYETPARWLSPLWFLASWVIPLAALWGGLRYFKRWPVAALGLMAVVGIFLSKGVSDPFGEVYHFFVFGPLTPDAFRWLFRVASKWNVFVSLAYSILVGIGIFALLQCPPRGLLNKVPRRAITVLIVAGFLTVFGLFAWPSFTGDFRGALDPVILPADIQGANEWLARTGGSTKVNWMPVTNGREISWNRRPSGDLYTSLSPLSSIGTNWNRHPVLFYSYIYEALVNQRTRNFGRLLSILNTHYVAYHDDIVSTHIHVGVEPVSVLIEEGEETIPEQLARQTDMQQAWQQESVTIFQSAGYPGDIYVPARLWLATGDLSTLTSLVGFNSFDPVQNAVFFDGSRNEGQFRYPVDGLLLDAQAGDTLAFSFLPVDRLISAGRATSHGSVIENWSSLDIYQFDWQSVLHSYGLDHWGFDYGQGMAAFSDEFRDDPGMDVRLPSLDFETELEQAGIYHLWVRALAQKRAAKMQIFINDNPAILTDFTSDRTSFVWKEVGQFDLRAGKHKITITSHDGLSAVNALALLTDEEMTQMRQQSQDLAHTRPAIYILEAENNFWFDGKTPTREDALTEPLNGVQGLELRQGDVVKGEFYPASGGVVRAAMRMKAGSTVTLYAAGQSLHFAAGNNNSDLEWVISSPVMLPAEPIALTIEAGSTSFIDSLVWMNDKVVNDLETTFALVDPPARITTQKVDPTRYLVHVEAQRPFTLALAETYDPLWTVSGAGIRTSSYPLYGVINGFWIDRAGSFDLTIDYQPQQAARIGQLFSVVMGVICLFMYLGLGKIHSSRAKKV